MTFQANVSEFAEFMGTEIPDGGGSGSQSSDSMIITGSGRPDKPETTGGKVTGREPNGTFYNSTNGAGVGAYLWQKQNGQWTVISGDTGIRRLSNISVNIKEGAILSRRGVGTLFLFTGAVILNSRGKITPSEWIFYPLQEYQLAFVHAHLLCFHFIAMTGMKLLLCMLLV